MKKNNEPIVMRGEVWYADLSPSKGSEQGGMRPVLVIQNNIGNKHAPTTIVAPITSRLTKKLLPTHIAVAQGEGGLKAESIVLLEQIRVVDKQRLLQKLGALSSKKILEIDEAIRISLEV